MFFLKRWQWRLQQKELFQGALASTVPMDGDRCRDPDDAPRFGDLAGSPLAVLSRTACFRSLAMTGAGDHAGVAGAGRNSDIGVDFLLSFARGRIFGLLWWGGSAGPPG